MRLAVLCDLPIVRTRWPQGGPLLELTELYMTA
jgi:hypothetical protein